MRTLPPATIVPVRLVDDHARRNIHGHIEPFEKGEGSGSTAFLSRDVYLYQSSVRNRRRAGHHFVDGRSDRAGIREVRLAQN